MVSATRKKENAVRDMVSKKKAAEKKAAKAGKPSKAAKDRKTVDGAKKHMGAMVEDEDRSDVHTPGFRYDVHIKQSQITIEVTLHRANHNAINIDQTTDKKMVIDTTKGGGRKYFLEWEFPDKMTVDAEKGEYEYESGVLRIKYDVTKMPKSIVKQRESFIEKVTKQQKKRFEKKEEHTGLEMRSRTAELAKPDEQPAVAVAQYDEDDAVAKMQLALKKKRMEEPKKEKKEKGVATISADPKKRFVSDDDAIDVAKAAGNELRQTMQQRMKAARELQESRLVKTQHRESNRETKQDKKEKAYERILEQKRADLVKKTQLAAKPTKKAAPEGKNKNVKFVTHPSK